VSAKKTIGFGVPNEIDPHYFTVEIPLARANAVVISEHFGLQGGTNRTPDTIERCRLSRSTWTAIAEEAKRVLNERLKEKGIATSRWSTGLNQVERLLGRELCQLAWAVEVAPKALVANAIRNWAGFRPEERWWLFAMAANLTGTSDDTDIGWRKAMRIALTETPTGEEVAAIRRQRPKLPTEADRPSLPFFDKT
jgi:Protein of unknown function (DUF3780)